MSLYPHDTFRFVVCDHNGRHPPIHHGAAAGEDNCFFRHEYLRPPGYGDLMSN